jgi:uncharacterized membrane protein YvlD (DUF360 family)
MNYLKSFFLNFLVVFFAVHVLNGVDVTTPTKLPHLGSDIPFALVLGLLNSLIEPVFAFAFRPATVFRLLLTAFALNFGIFALVKFISKIGIDISSVEGYLSVSAAVAVASFLTNYLEMKHRQKQSGDGGGVPPTI